MTAYRRAFQPGGTYFFTVVTEHRRPLSIENIDRLRRAFRIGLERRPAHIDAIVVLPMGCIPGIGDGSSPRIWRILNWIDGDGHASLCPSYGTDSPSLYLTSTSRTCLT